MRVVRFFVVAIFAWTWSLVGAPEAAPAQARDPEESGVLPSPQDLETDLALVAESHGWTIEQARERHRVSEALGAVLGTIARERPDA
jgi:hypothetical protein